MNLLIFTKIPGSKYYTIKSPGFSFAIQVPLHDTIESLWKSGAYSYNDAPQTLFAGRYVSLNSTSGY
jgi:hypothetical protein